MHERILYGHRGAPFEVPENTIPSFLRALELGANAIETDCHVTADGVPVLAHDPTGARMAGVDAAVRACRLDEVRRWDAGWGFVGPDGAQTHAERGYRVPTLVEALLALPSVRFNVDLKDGRPEAVRAVVEVVRAAGAAERVLLTSFDARAIARVVRAGYEGPIGLGGLHVVRLVASPEWLLRRWRVPGVAAQIPRAQGPLRLDSAAFIARCHALGLRVDFWTIDEPWEAALLLSRGADGVVSNRPDRVARTMEQAPPFDR